jgi:hypothetical protein
MKNKIFTLWLCLLCTVVLWVGCGHRATGGDPTGTWRAEDGETVHFGKDGAYSLKAASVGNQPGAEMAGTYTKSGATQLTVKIASAEREGQALYDYSVTGDQLTLRGAGTEIVRVYKRVGN